MAANRRFGVLAWQEFAVILVSSILINNYVLVQFLGLCPFMGVSNKLESAIGMAAATTFVLTLTAMASYIVNAMVLEPLGLIYLRTIAFILVIAAVVQFTKMFIEKTSPLLYRVLGVFSTPDYHQLCGTGCGSCRTPPKISTLCSLPSMVLAPVPVFHWC